MFIVTLISLIYLKYFQNCSVVKLLYFSNKTKQLT